MNTRLGQKNSKNNHSYYENPYIYSYYGKSDSGKIWQQKESQIQMEIESSRNNRIHAKKRKKSCELSKSIQESKKFDMLVNNLSQLLFDINKALMKRDYYIINNKEEKNKKKNAKKAPPPDARIKGEPRKQVHKLEAVNEFYSNQNNSELVPLTQVQHGLKNYDVNFNIISNNLPKTGSPLKQHKIDNNNNDQSSHITNFFEFMEKMKNNNIPSIQQIFFNNPLYHYNLGSNMLGQNSANLKNNLNYASGAKIIQQLSFCKEGKQIFQLNKIRYSRGALHVGIAKMIETKKSKKIEIMKKNILMRDLLQNNGKLFLHHNQQLMSENKIPCLCQKNKQESKAKDTLMYQYF